MPKSDYGDFSQSPQPGELSDREVFGPWSDEEVFGDPREWRVNDGYKLTPVEGNPFEDGHKLTPVDYDPFVNGAVDTDSFGVPTAFLNRVHQGQVLKRVIDRAFAGAQEGYGAEPIGIPVADLNRLQELGIFYNPHTGKPGYAGILGEAAIDFTWNNVENLMRMVRAGVYGAGGVFGQLVEELTGNETQGVKAEREAINAANFLMLDGGMGHFARPHVGPDNIIRSQTIGGLPTKWDFRNAADALGLPTDAPLRELWQEKGIHPAEAVQNAAQDAFLHDELRAAAGAEVTAPENLPTLEQQPPPPPGAVMAGVRSALDKLYDIVRDFQMKVAPMAIGTGDSMAIAKDFANALRRNRWEWSRIDSDVAARFTPEQRKRMWDAADEESVAIQLGESREHQGLITLTDEERAAVDDLQARSQLAWLHAVNIGIVEGEGLPSYTPRMVINVANAAAEEGRAVLNRLPDPIGMNLRTRTAQMLHREHMTAEETEAAAKEKLGEGAQIARDIRALPLATAKLEDAIAGRTLIDRIREAGRNTGSETVAEGWRPPDTDEATWFTIDHPAFYQWRPRFQDGAVVKDADGNTVFDRVPIYVRGDFEGPLKAVLSEKSGALYNAAMELKGKTMGLIMNSPLIHNMVILGKVIPAFPGKAITGKLYFQGYRAKNDIGLMREAIDNGLVPIGKRFFNQDITSIMEEPNLTPGRSLTAQILGFIPGLFDPAADIAVRRAIDKAGDFWHNTMLWDRVGDLQMGVYVNLRDNLIAKGELSPQTASRVAANFANRLAGSIPVEAMSAGARKTLNIFLFSRSFTATNWAVFKDALGGVPPAAINPILRAAGLDKYLLGPAGGLPRDVLAQIERDAGPAEAALAKSYGRRKAVATILIDAALFYAGYSVLQSIINVMRGDNTLDAEMHGYVTRLAEAMQKRTEHPLTLTQPFDFMQSLSATHENEPERQDKVLVGYASDGTAVYARVPFGKFPEELVGWLTGPLDILRRKEGTITRPLMELLANDKGFGRRVYDPNADTPEKYAGNAYEIAKHLITAQLPMQQINAFADLVKGDGDPNVNAAQAFGPFAGVTFSRGARGGPAFGWLYQARTQHQYQVDTALPDIRRQILRGDERGARDRMTELGIAPGLQKYYIRTTINPATRLNGRTLRDFYLYGTDEQKQRMERVLH